jgi:hypothetical protein
MTTFGCSMIGKSVNLNEIVTSKIETLLNIRPIKVNRFTVAKVNACNFIY